MIVGEMWDCVGGNSKTHFTYLQNCQIRTGHAENSYENIRQWSEDLKFYPLKSKTRLLFARTDCLTSCPKMQ